MTSEDFEKIVICLYDKLVLPKYPDVGMINLILTQDEMDTLCICVGVIRKRILSGQTTRELQL